MFRKKELRKFVPKKLFTVSSVFIAIVSFIVFRNYLAEVYYLIIYRILRINFDIIGGTFLYYFRNVGAFIILVFILYELQCLIFMIWLESKDVAYWEEVSKSSSYSSLQHTRYRNKVKETEQDFEKLSSYMAHEQKNMLAILRGKIQMKEDVELLEEVDHVARSIDDILTLSASSSMIAEQQVDMSEVVASSVDEYRKVYPNIDFIFDEEVSFLVSGRELWISRAVSNLIENAIKYGDDGKITVELACKKGSVILTVLDEGNSLNTEEKSKIFEMYYRTEGIKKDGYGIGLGLVKHVCDLCNGLFWVEKVDSGGAKFYIVLPELNGKNGGEVS